MKSKNKREQRWREREQRRQRRRRGDRGRLGKRVIGDARCVTTTSDGGERSSCGTNGGNECGVCVIVIVCVRVYFVAAAVCFVFAAMSMM